MRLGRATALLRATLGDFMRIGLVDYDTSHTPGHPSSSGLGLGLGGLGTLGGLLDILGASGRAKAHHRDSLPQHLRTRHDADCPVYHPHITFKFRPPHAHSSAQGDADTGSPLLTFSGRPMYFASAHILRHALYALFSETTIVTERVNLHRGPHSPCGGTPDAQDAPPATTAAAPGGDAHRQATLVLRLTFTGVVRVTQQMHEYTVIFKYRFDPDTGMIVEHKVDRIEPVPGKKVSRSGQGEGAYRRRASTDHSAPHQR